MRVNLTERFNPLEGMFHKECMEQAEVASVTSTCVKKKVGSALYKGRELQARGYGGSAHGCSTCISEKGNFTHDTCWSIHAEMRAITKFLQDSNEKRNLGLSKDLILNYREDLVMYVTHGPCDQCLKSLDYVNIRTVVYRHKYKTDYSKWSGIIQVFQLEGETLTLENP